MTTSIVGLKIRSHRDKSYPKMVNLRDQAGNVEEVDAVDLQFPDFTPEGIVRLERPIGALLCLSAVYIEWNAWGRNSSVGSAWAHCP